jgi:hypothetical protein
MTTRFTYSIAPIARNSALSTRSNHFADHRSLAVGAPSAGRFILSDAFPASVKSSAQPRDGELTGTDSSMLTRHEREDCEGGLMDEILAMARKMLGTSL